VCKQCSKLPLHLPGPRPGPEPQQCRPPGSTPPTHPTNGVWYRCVFFFLLGKLCSWSTTSTSSPQGQSSSVRTGKATTACVSYSWAPAAHVITASQSHHLSYMGPAAPLSQSKAAATACSAQHLLLSQRHRICSFHTHRPSPPNIHAAIARTAAAAAAAVPQASVIWLG
jgi:hypothetical protein